MKKTKHNSEVIIGAGYMGLGNQHIRVHISGDFEEVVIGEHEDEEEGADPILAIEDSIKTLKVLIMRLEKLKATKTPMQTTTHGKINELNYYHE